LGGAINYSGASIINTGTLQLDASSTGSVLPSGVGRNFGGGAISIVQANNVGTTTQNFASIALGSGASTFSQSPGTSSNIVENLSAITRPLERPSIPGRRRLQLYDNQRARLRITAGGWAVFGGTTWATSAGTGASAGALTGLAEGSYVADKLLKRRQQHNRHNQQHDHRQNHQ